MSPTSSVPDSHDRRLKLRDVPWRQVAGETVVVDPGGRRLFLMNGTAGVVWDGLAADLGRAAIADRIVARFEVDVATARCDVDAFFDALEAAGLATAETDHAR